MTTTIINDNLWVNPNVVPTPVCEYLIKHLENTQQFKECTMNKVMDKNYRDSHQVHIDDHDLARMVWKFVKPFVPQKYQGRKIVGAHYKTFYLLRYGPGQKFHTHRDGHSTNAKGQKSFLTALIYLNSDCVGGQTRFYAEPEHELHLTTVTGSDEQGSYYDAIPTEGSLALMRHYILHAAVPVQQGVKYALRFNILYESFGEWYNGPATTAKFEGVGINCGVELAPYSHNVDAIGAAWKEAENKRKQGQEHYTGHYKFLPVDPQPRGRPPKPGEYYCNNCYEILDLRYDYYTCPRCQAPVVYASRATTLI